MKLKQLVIASLAALALVACGSPVSQTVARFDNVTLSQQELDTRIGRIQEAAQKQQGQGEPPSPDAIKRSVVDLFIQQNILLNLGRQRGLTLTDQDVDAEIDRIRSNVEQQGTTLDEIIQGRLGMSGAESSDFRQFVSSLIVQDRLSQTLVTTDTVRQEVADQIMPQTKQMVNKADVAHILVETEEEAKQVIERLNQGEKFEDLAKELSKDPGSAQNGGVYKGMQQGQTVPEFDKAIFQDLQPGETTTTPVKTQFGYHIIRLLSRGEGPALTEEQAQQQIEQAVDQQLVMRRQQALQELVEQERQKAKDEGRLEEPTFADPTAAPPDSTPADGSGDSTAVPEQPTEPAPTAQP